MPRSNAHSRHRARLAGLATIVAVTAFGIVVAPPGAWAAGTPALTDAYTTQARYNPGTAVTVSAVVHETTGTGSWSGSVGFTLTHLGSTVSTGSVPVTPDGDYAHATLPAPHIWQLLVIDLRPHP